MAFVCPRRCNSGFAPFLTVRLAGAVSAKKIQVGLLRKVLAICCASFHGMWLLSIAELLLERADGPARSATVFAESLDAARERIPQSLTVRFNQLFDPHFAEPELRRRELRENEVEREEIYSTLISGGEHKSIHSRVGREKMQLHLMSPLLVADAIELTGHTAIVGWLRDGGARENLVRNWTSQFQRAVFAQGFLAA